MFNQKEFNGFVIDNGAIGFFENEITLKSGRKSHWYINWRTVLNDAKKLDTLCAFILAKVSDLDLVLYPESFIGVPEGATKIGIHTQMLQCSSTNANSCIPMGRAKPKEHGDPKDKYFVGEPKGKTAIIEDVTTTGGSCIEFTKRVMELDDAEVVLVLGLSNRMAKRDDGLSVKEKFAEMGVRYEHMSSALELLPIVVEQQKPSLAIISSIEKEFAEVGIETLSLDIPGLENDEGEEYPKTT